MLDIPAQIRSDNCPCQLNLELDRPEKELSGCLNQLRCASGHPRTVTMGQPAKVIHGRSVNR